VGIVNSCAKALKSREVNAERAASWEASNVVEASPLPSSSPLTAYRGRRGRRSGIASNSSQATCAGCLQNIGHRYHPQSRSGSDAPPHPKWINLFARLCGKKGVDGRLAAGRDSSPLPIRPATNHIARACDEETPNIRGTPCLDVAVIIVNRMLSVAPQEDRGLMSKFVTALHFSHERERSGSSR